jgi:two-component system LytT family response regulator
MPQALIIDDEISARTDLRAKLGAHTGVTVAGEAGTLRAARALLGGADYDLVFLDVELIGGESFQLLPEVRPGAGVVFVTAHDRYAVRAFESAAIDYLLKPVVPARLAEALRRAAAHAAMGSRPPVSAPEWAGRPAALAPLPAAAGVAALAEDGAEVILTAHERVFLRQCLEAWENSLPPTHVLRAPQPLGAARARTVRYARGAEPTRLFIAGASASRVHRWWRALRRTF